MQNKAYSSYSTIMTGIMGVGLQLGEKCTYTLETYFKYLYIDGGVSWHNPIYKGVGRFRGSQGAFLKKGVSVARDSAVCLYSSDGALKAEFQTVFRAPCTSNPIIELSECASRCSQGRFSVYGVIKHILMMYL